MQKRKHKRSHEYHQINEKNNMIPFQNKELAENKEELLEI
jgi:hypothetical protein